MRGFYLFILLLPLFIACSPHEGVPQSAPEVAAAKAIIITDPSRVEAQITSDVPSEAKALLLKDFTRLEKTSIKDSNSEATKIFGIPSINQQTLIHWLNERIQYIVSDRFLDKEKIQNGILPSYVTVLSNEHNFENKNELPDVLRPEGQARSIAFALAENYGALLYLIGKSTNSLFGLLIPGEEDFIAVNSPRIGLLGVGQNLFQDWMKENIRFQDKSLKGELDSLLATEYRLGIIFHEARHSDGNGRSLGFFHAKCPVDHDYAGQFACDSSLNGAYSIGGAYLKLASQACDDCSEKDKEVLRVFSLDAFSRVLLSKRTRISEEETLHRCEDLLKGNQQLPSECFYNETPAEFWDASPEGVRGK